MVKRRTFYRIIKALNFLKLFQYAIMKWLADKAFKMSAAICFYTIISLGPLLLISVVIAGMFFGQDAVTGRIVNELSEVVGSDIAFLVQDAIVRSNTEGSGLFTTIVNIVVFLWAATSLFAEVHDSLNIIYKVKSKRGKVLLSLIVERVLSFLMILFMGVFLIVSIMFGTIISFLTNIFGQYFAIHVSVIEGINLLVMYGLTFLLLSFIYKFLVDAKIYWKDVFLGSVVATTLFMFGRYLINLYIANTNYSSVFGAAGSLVMLLLWVYYSAQIVIYGAEFIYVYATRYGHGIEGNYISESQK
jgi:membrane protein